MMRWLINFLGIGSLLVCVAAVALLGWSPRYERWDYQSPHKLYSAVIFKNTLQVAQVDRPVGPERWTFSRQSLQNIGGDRWWKAWATPNEVKNFIGFGRSRAVIFG
jgi:hypothetical protein